MNILIVDDNRLLNRFLTTFFREKGHTATALAEKAKKEQLTNMMIGGALGYLFGGGKLPGLK